MKNELKIHLHKILNISLLIIFFSTVTLTANGQGRSTEAIVRSVADHVISNTTFQFTDAKTHQHYASASGVDASAELKAESQYNRWEYANGVLMIGMMATSKALHDPQYEAYARKNYKFIFNNVIRQAV